MSDWRLQGQEKYMNSIVLRLEKYKVFNKDWDHDHCEFCNKKFSENKDDGLNEGYTTPDHYRWVCLECYKDFKSKFNWISEFKSGDRIRLLEDLTDIEISNNKLPKGSVGTIESYASIDGEVVNVRMDVDSKDRTLSSSKIQLITS